MVQLYIPGVSRGVKTEEINSRARTNLYRESIFFYEQSGEESQLNFDYELERFASFVYDRPITEITAEKTGIDLVVLAWYNNLLSDSCLLNGVKLEDYCREKGEDQLLE